jgi:sugar-phosphatase
VFPTGVPNAPDRTTTGPRRIGDSLDEIGMGRQFDVMITSDDVEQGKPSPEGYLKGCAELGIDPVHVFAFEDAPAGIAAARSAVMTCVALTTTHHRAALEQAHAVVADFTQLSWPLTVVGLAPDAEGRPGEEDRPVGA